MYLRILFTLLVGSVLLMTSCENTNDDTEDPTDEMVLVGSSSDNGLLIEMYADQDLKVGLNKLNFKLSDESSGDEVTQASITHKPMMYMESMKHSCPFTNPELSANSEGLFESELVFIMASGMMGSWDDTVTVNNPTTNTDHKVVFENLSVLETNMKKNLVFLDGDSNQVIYIVTLNELEAPEVGSNPFTLTVHKKASMMSFPEVADLSLEVNPQMPSMGHGSNGNVNPVYDENGKYNGAVVFSMTGYWTVDFTFSAAGDSLGAVQYEFNL